VEAEELRVAVTEVTGERHEMMLVSELTMALHRL
jgi:hypothetical protein